MKVDIKILHKNASQPAYQTEQSAGMDLTAQIDEPVKIEPHGRVIIPTGIAISLPVGYEAQIRGRSGMAAKFGITLANGVGTIDADYRGEIGVILLNTSDQSFVVEPGMRIAQMVVASHECVEWNEVGQLDETERGSGGYGSTGHA